VATPLARARAALDAAFAEAIKLHFLGFVGQVDGDLGKNLKGDSDHFR
jgi:hypothetical protein